MNTSIYITAKLTDEINQKIRELKVSKKELDRIRKSRTYKTGEMVLYVPKRVKQMLK